MFAIRDYSKKIGYLCIFSFILLISILLFNNIDDKMFDKIKAEGGDKEPYSIYIVAGQSNAEGTQSKWSDLPEGQKIRQHPADDDVNPNDNAQIWWEGSDGNELTGSWSHIQHMFTDPLYNPAGWMKSDSNPAPSLRNGLVNFKDLDEPPPLGQRLGFFGPELGIAREAYDQGRRKVIILKVSYGFQALAKSVTTFVPFDWNPDVANNGQPDNPQRSDKAYRHLISAYNELTTELRNEGKSYTVDGFFWYQGETDTLDTYYANLYKQNFETLVNRAREDMHMHPNAHFVARKFNMKYCRDNANDPFSSTGNYCGFSWFTRIEGITPQNFLQMFETRPFDVIPLNADRTRTVRQAMQDVADKYEWVDVMETDPGSDFAGDYVHLLAGSQLARGREIYNMYKQPYRPALSVVDLATRNDYDRDGLDNTQEDTGRGIGCPYIINNVVVSTAGNGNLGDDDSDCDGFPNYIDNVNGPGSGMNGL